MTKGHASPSRFRRVAYAATAATLGALMSGAAPALAAMPGADMPVLRSSASDDRADFHEGNAERCNEIGGVPDDAIQLSGHGPTSEGDGYVEGTTDGTQQLNVDITADGVDVGVVIDAVVVKGGNGYNVYRDPHLPPGLPSPQNYISPFNDGGNVPDISHWFVCYHLEEPAPGEGGLVVSKALIPPLGPPAQALPESFSVTVSCVGDDYAEEFELTFGSGGGLPEEGLEGLSTIPAGTVCTVTEQDVSQFPPGTQVTYLPPGADDTGVTIPDDGTITVVVTNNFSGVETLTGDVRVIKIVAVTGQVGTPESFSVGVTCSDGTTETVTLPGDGGAGTPVVEVVAGAECAVQEMQVPDGWNVSYAVDGGESTSARPSFVVEGDQTVEVAVTNTASAPPVDGTSAPPADGTSAPPELPNTGGNALDIASGAWEVLFVLAAIFGIGGIAYALDRRAT